MFNGCQSLSCKKTVHDILILHPIFVDYITNPVKLLHFSTMISVKKNKIKNLFRVVQHALKMTLSQAPSSVRRAAEHKVNEKTNTRRKQNCLKYLLKYKYDDTEGH